MEDELSRIARSTLEDYERTAESFWAATKDHDVTQNYDALLSHIDAARSPSPWTILDFGCGPGRDLRYFASLGHRAVGLDGCPRFCAMARAHSGCEVLEQSFFALALPASTFDGVFANASLFHVPSAELARVLGQLHDALKPRGVLFASNPRGANEEGWKRDRFGCFYDWENWSTRVQACGFEAITHYYRPTGKPRDEQPWLASVWRRS